MKYMKRILSMMLCIILVCGTSAHASDFAIAPEDENLILAYYSAVATKECTKFSEILSDQYCNEIESILNNDEYAKMKIGLHNVIAVNGITILGEIPKDLYEYYDPILSDINAADIKIYLVSCDLNVDHEDEFNHNDTNYQIVFCGTEHNQRNIVDCRVASDIALNRCLPDNELEALAAWDRCSYNVPPSTIKVLRWMYGNGAIENVPFKEYVKVTTALEYGGDNYDEDYHYVGILSVRNYAWYFILNANPNRGYHVTDTSSTNGNQYGSYQNYWPDRYSDANTWKNTFARTDAIWDQNFVSSDYKIFCSWYTGDKYTANYQGSGRINQPLVKDFANQGKTWKEILSYFYSNSERSPGEIQYFPTGNHIYYKIEVVGNDFYRVCLCGARTYGGSQL